MKKKKFPGQAAAICAIAIACALSAYGQVAVPVGAGSYASFPLASEGTNVIGMLSSNIYATDPDQPIPTNDWWTDLLVSRYAGTMWATPLAVSTDAQGVNVSFPTKFNADGTSMTTESPLRISGEVLPNPGPNDVLLADFESTTYPPGWTTTGTAFGSGPAAGTLTGQSAVSGYLGSKLVNSYRPNDGATGTLTGPTFTISQDYLHFLIGGGNHPGATEVQLVVSNAVVRTATGSDSEALRWTNWNVGDLRGQTGRIKIIDTATGGWGHICADQFLLSADSTNVAQKFDTTFAAANTKAKKWSDWLVQFRSAEDADRYIDVTMGHGLPFVWFEFHNAKPRVKSGAGARYFNEGGTITTFPVTADHLGIQYDGRLYGIYAPDGTQFSMTGDTLTATPPAGAGTYLAVGALKTESDLVEYRSYAFAIPRETRMDWEFDTEHARVHTTWTVTAEALKGTGTNVLQGWIPHHYRSTTNNLVFNGKEYLSPRGKLKLTAGNRWTIDFPFRGIAPTLPAPHPLGLANDFDPERMKLYVQLYATKTNYGAETYFGGKDLTQFGIYMNFARQLGMDAEFLKLRQSLRNALADWFTYTPGEMEHYFARYPNWRALVGFNESFYSYEFTDHHFHYGYFTHATALLGMQDAQFLADYGPMARLVAKEYANWEREDTSFPFLRTFDVWNGHSYAGGTSSPGGNNQESSSEAMQSWTGLFLLGTMLADPKMAAAGAMGYSMESLAVEEYWNNYYGWRDGAAAGNFDSKYANTNTITGILFDSGQAFATYFSGDPGWMYGIQWLPVGPELSYLVRDPVFAKYQFTNMMARRAIAIAPAANTISQMGEALGQVILGYVQLFDPGYVAAQMDQLWEASDPVATANDTPGITYYFTHANRGLGKVAWEFTTSVPTSQSYFNADTGVYTHVVYNPTDAFQIVNVYNNGVFVGNLLAPPRELKAFHELLSPSPTFSALTSFPADGETNVSRGLKQLSIAFTQPVDQSSLGAVSISGPGVGLSLAAASNPSLAVFNISGNAQTGATYQVTVPASILSSGGTPLGRDYTFSFSIETPVINNNDSGSFLSAHYRLDENSGTVAADSSSNHLDGVFVNNPALAQAGARAATGTSAHFDGTNSYVQLPRTFTLDILGDFTVVAWIRPDAVNGDRPVVGTDGFGPQQGLHLLVRDGKPYFGFYGDDTPGSRTITAGQWQQIAFRFHQGEQAIFVDGALDVASEGHRSFAGLDPVLIGRWGGNSGVPKLFQGSIDDVQIYHRGLTDAEIAALHTNPGSDNTNGLQNFPPIVNAGANQVLNNPAVVSLNGFVADDGLPNPPGAFTASWSKVSGPGTVTFTDGSSPFTTARFSAPGSYVLRLTASDGGVSGSDDVSIALLAGDLIVHYQLDETSGTVCADSSGNGMNGVFVGSPTLGSAGAAAGSGASVAFNGTSQIVQLGTPALLSQLTNNFTIAAWVRPDNISGNRIIFGSNWQDQNGWSLRLSGGSLALERLGPSQLYNSGKAIPTAKWTHVAAAYASNNTVTFFTNGVAVATIAGSSPASPSTRPWYIAGNGSGENVAGRIDDVQIYNRELAPAEVAYLTSNPGKIIAPTKTSPLLSIQVGGTGVILSWPDAGQNFTVLEAATVDASTSWTPVETTPISSSGQWRLLVAPTNSARFFRLRSE